MAFQAHSFTLDGATKLQDAGSVAASAASTYSYDMGGANVYGKFAVVIDLASVSVGTGQYVQIAVQVSDTSGFSNTYTLSSRFFGDTGSIGAPVDTAPNQRAVMYCDNVACTSATDANSLIAGRYVRLYVTIAGASTTCNFQAWLVPIQ